MNLCFQFFTLLASAFYPLIIHAKTSINVVLTPAPRAQEVIVVPAGYSRCYQVASGFYDGVWQYQHRVCEYPQQKSWVSGHWQCTRYRPNGYCTQQIWLKGHWLYHKQLAHPYSNGQQHHRHAYSRHEHGHESYPQAQQQIHGHR